VRDLAYLPEKGLIFVVFPDGVYC